MLGTLRCASFPVGLLPEDGADSPVDIGGCVGILVLVNVGVQTEDGRWR